MTGVQTCDLPICVYGIVLAGYAANSKYPYLGGIRSSAQMISYEIAMGMSVIPIFLLVGSLNLSDVIQYQAGGGWLIFALPPAELAVHPADGAGRHELYLMCDDIHATLAELRGKGAEVARDVSDQGWGLLAAIRLPDGGELPIYEPRHPSPLQP